MRELVQLSVRGPAGTRETALALKVVDQGDTLHLCGKERCPHWGGQAGLLFVPDDFGCLLLTHAALPGQTRSKLCQPFYLEAAEDLHEAGRDAAARMASDAEALREDLLSDLDRAEAFERQTAQLAQEAGL